MKSLDCACSFSGDQKNKGQMLTISTKLGNEEEEDNCKRKEGNSVLHSSFTPPSSFTRRLLMQLLLIRFSFTAFLHSFLPFCVSSSVFVFFCACSVRLIHSKSPSLLSCTISIIFCLNLNDKTGVILFPVTDTIPSTTVSS